MKNIVCAVLICGSIIGVGTIAISHRPSPSVQKPSASENETVVRAWLESQRKGQKGTQHWASDWFVEPISLYAVSQYEIVDSNLDLTFTVRIHSSTRGGQPVVRLYEVFARGGKIMSIKAQGDGK
jgi:hypothetical protein